jgi:small subunit ribosomal protein S3
LGHKVHPYGFRIGIIKPWLAKWYADRDYATLLQEDMRIRELVAKQLANASVSQVEIERGINHVTVTVHTAKPGIVIGKGGANVEALRTNIGKLTDKKVKLEIKEILQPELDGMLLAQNVAGQLERRIAFRKAIKQSIQRTIKAGAKGVKIQVSGRLGGAEMSRTEWDKEGRIPLGTLRADISYGVVHAHTTYGRIGVKAWVYRGEQLGDRPGSARTEPRAARRGATAARGRGTGRSAEPAAGRVKDAEVRGPVEGAAARRKDVPQADDAQLEAPSAQVSAPASEPAPTAAPLEAEQVASTVEATAQAPAADASEVAAATTPEAPVEVADAPAGPAEPAAAEAAPPEPAADAAPAEGAEPSTTEEKPKKRAARKPARES